MKRELTTYPPVETSVADLDVDFNFCDVIRFNHPCTGENSLNRFDPAALRGKQALSIEINRDLILHNPENIAPTRVIVNQLVLAMAAWGRG